MIIEVKANNEEILEWVKSNFKSDIAYYCRFIIDEGLLDAQEAVLKLEDYKDKIIYCDS